MYQTPKRGRKYSERQRMELMTLCYSNAHISACCMTIDTMIVQTPEPNKSQKQ